MTPEQLAEREARRKRAERLDKANERRSWTVHDVECREAADGTLTLTGYASVFDAPYEMYGGPPYGWTEVVDPAAFDATLRSKPDVQLLVNHDGLPLARTKSGTLRLSADNIGLRVEAELDPADPDVQALVPKMRRGDLDEMSFAFRTIRQEWNEEYTERRLLEVSVQKGDVSVVNYGANPATSAAVRSLVDVRGALAELGQAQRELTDVERQVAEEIIDALEALLGIDDEAGETDQQQNSSEAATDAVMPASLATRTAEVLALRSAAA